MARPPYNPCLDAGRHGSTATAAERAAQVRDCFVRGLSAAAAAERLGMSITTVRDHFSLLRHEGLTPIAPAADRVTDELLATAPPLTVTERRRTASFVTKALQTEPALTANEVLWQMALRRGRKPRPA
jgi:transposase